MVCWVRPGGTDIGHQWRWYQITSIPEGAKVPEASYQPHRGTLLHTKLQWIKEGTKILLLTQSRLNLTAHQLPDATTQVPPHPRLQLVYISNTRYIGAIETQLSKGRELLTYFQNWSWKYKLLIKYLAKGARKFECKKNTLILISVTHSDFCLFILVWGGHTHLYSWLTYSWLYSGIISGSSQGTFWGANLCNISPVPPCLKALLAHMSLWRDREGCPIWECNIVAVI